MSNFGGRSSKCSRIAGSATVFHVHPGESGKYDTTVGVNFLLYSELFPQPLDKCRKEQHIQRIGNKECKERKCETDFDQPESKR